MNGPAVSKGSKGAHWWPAGETSGRPYGLTLVAGLQYVKAAILLLFCAQPLIFPRPHQASDSLFAIGLSAIA